jgi:hypothetical protein
VAGALCLLVHGCDTGTGGAVELSWKLRPASSSLPDKFVECEPGQDELIPGRKNRGTVQRIRLNWQVIHDGQLIKDYNEWACGLNHGATKFELPEGIADLSVVPLCTSDQPPDPPTYMAADPRTYIAPAPVQRVVIHGDTVSLGAVELVISVSPCDTDHPCICAA